MAVAQVYWEEDGEERKSESNERERRKRGRGIQVPSGGRLVVRRQAGGGRAGHLAASTQLLKVEDNGQICEKPPGFGVFSWEVENITLLQYFVKQTRSKDYEVNQGLFREKVEAPHIFI
jgi:hypothetical protein